MLSLKEIALRRTEILNEMAEIDRMRRGGLSKQYFKTIEKGQKITRGPYYVLQCSLNGKNYCERVSADDVEAVESAIGGYEHFRRLADEFIEITEELTLKQEGDFDGKKKEKRLGRRSFGRPKCS